jgi:hypothetical protein
MTIKDLPGTAKYTAQRQRYLEGLHCSVNGCTWPHRYPTAPGAVFCAPHWRHYIATKVVHYQHQQTAIAQRSDIDKSSLKQRISEVLAMDSDEIASFLAMYHDVVSIVDDVNEVQ